MFVRAPPLDPKQFHHMSLQDHRTRLLTAQSPGHPQGLPLFEGLPSPSPRLRIPKPLYRMLRPGLTPWMHDWWTDKNDFLPKDGLDYFDDDIPDDGFSLGEPLEETNFWEKKWIDAHFKKEEAEMEAYLLKSSKRKRSVPLSAAGRKRAWKKRAVGKTIERVNGKFVKKKEIIIIGDEDEESSNDDASLKSIFQSLKVEDQGCRWLSECSDMKDQLG